MTFRPLLILLFATAMFAQDSLAPAPSKAPKVTAAPISTVRVKQGTSAPVLMMFRVHPGYHINSNKPNSELMIPTAVKLDVPTDISVAKMTYPAGKDYSFSFSPDEKISVYSGDFAVKGLVVTNRKTPRGTFRVHGTLKYQACDNRACYPPATIPLQFDVNVQKVAVVTRTRPNPAQSPHIHH